MTTYLITDPGKSVIYGQTDADSVHDALLETMNHPQQVLLDGERAREIEAHPVGWLADDVWREVAPVGPNSQGDCGGDVQVSDSWSRRFAMVRQDGTLAVLTHSWYAINESVEFVRQDTLGEVIERQSEHVICDDIRALDYVVWEDVRYGKEIRFAADGEGARAAAEAFKVADINWNGEQFR
jgi:hypothetical protein